MVRGIMKKEFDAEITSIEMGSNYWRCGMRMFSRISAKDSVDGYEVSFLVKNDEVAEWVGKRLHVTVEAAE